MTRGAGRGIAVLTVCILLTGTLMWLRGNVALGGHDCKKVPDDRINICKGHDDDDGKSCNKGNKPTGCCKPGSWWWSKSSCEWSCSNGCKCQNNCPAPKPTPTPDDDDDDDDDNGGSGPTNPGNPQPTPTPAPTPTPTRLPVGNVPKHIDCLKSPAGDSFIPLDIEDWSGRLRWADPGNLSQDLSPAPGTGTTILLGGRKSGGGRDFYWCPPSGGSACLGTDGQVKLRPYTSYDDKPYDFIYPLSTIATDFYGNPVLEFTDGPWYQQDKFKLHSGNGTCRLIPAPTPTPAVTPPVPAPPGPNFGSGGCGCQGDDLSQLGSTGVDWLATAAFDAYVTTVCSAVSGPYVEMKPFVTGWSVDPPHPTLHSQSRLSQASGGNKVEVTAQASAPRTARCTAQDVADGDLPVETTPALSCTGVQAHLTTSARSWIAGALQRHYPGSRVKGSGNHCTSASKRPDGGLRPVGRRADQPRRLRDDRARLLRLGLPPD